MSWKIPCSSCISSSSYNPQPIGIQFAINENMHYELIRILLWKFCLLNVKDNYTFNSYTDFIRINIFNTFKYEKIELFSTLNEAISDGRMHVLCFVQRIMYMCGKALILTVLLNLYSENVWWYISIKACNMNIVVKSCHFVGNSVLWRWGMYANVDLMNVTKMCLVFIYRTRDNYESWRILS